MANAIKFSSRGLNLQTNLFPQTDTIHRVMIFERNFRLDIDGCMFGPYNKYRRLYFSENDYALSSETMNYLDDIIASYNDNYARYPRVEVNGHSGTQEGNSDLLSEMRALTIVKYLIDNGFDATNIKWKSYENTKPLYKNEKNVLEKQENRRVDLSIIYN